MFLNFIEVVNVQFRSPNVEDLENIFFLNHLILARRLHIRERKLVFSIILYIFQLKKNELLQKITHIAHVLSRGNSFWRPSISLQKNNLRSKIGVPIILLHRTLFSTQKNYGHPGVGRNRVFFIKGAADSTISSISLYHQIAT